MKFIKAHWKQLLTLIASMAVGLALHFGYLSADSATAIGAMLALVGIHLAPITYGAVKDAAPKVGAVVFVLLGLGAICSTQSACNASAEQLQQTEADSFKLAGCVLGLVLGGITDPGAIGSQCVGALPAVIVDIINDFEAKPAVDGGAVGASLSADKQALLDEAKKKALALK